MLHTLIEIGRQVGEGRHPWEDFLLKIKLKDQDLEKRQLLLRIVFDVDTGSIITEDGLRAYTPEKRADYGLIDVLKGNNKAVYAGVATKDLDKLVKALYGKTDKNGTPAESGEFIEAIRKEIPDLKSSELYEALTLAKEFEQTFLGKFTNDNDKLAIQDIPIGKQDILVATYVALTSAVRGWEAKPLAQMDGYKTFIEGRFLSSSTKDNTGDALRLCYVTGEMCDDTAAANFSARYNLNKVFQGTTINYVSNFEKGNLAKNYQISEEVRQLLDRGSSQLLADFQVKIGGLAHVCIPRLPMGSDYDIEEYRRLKSRTDLIFRLKDIESVLSELEDQAEDDLYWLDFFGIESDGNFLKLTNHIRDVSGLHVHNLIEQSKRVSMMLKDYLRGRLMNFGRIYYLIPVRKDLKANHALDICKMVLERRPIRESLLWQHFSELVLCHWFGRYAAYANIIAPNRDDILDLLLREAVFSYHAFRQILINLNLLIMETNQVTSASKTGAEVEARILQFLDDLGYSPAQRAMFFLGKALKRVVREQRKDGKTKTALDMVNFNGLDERSIRNMAGAIMEKGRQYSGKSKFASNLEYDLNRFFQHFPAGENNWRMEPREALFFFLSGYTHYTPNVDELPGADSNGGTDIDSSN